MKTANTVDHRNLTTVEAIRECLRQAMEADDTVLVMGEDVVGGAGLGGEHEGSMGGTFGATRGLFEEFGSLRVRDTPISEAGVAGVAIGAAVAGLRPVVDLMWSSFGLLALDQIFNQAAKYSYMSGGQVSVPVTFRMAMGAGLGGAGQHSDTLSSLFAHLPGIRVVVPSGPYDAKGLLWEAIFEPNPVVFMEPLSVYRRRELVPADPYRISFGQVSVVREGLAATLFGIGSTVATISEAADQLSAIGIEVCVVDLRTLSPLDRAGIVEMATLTRRVVVVDESPPHFGLAGELLALCAEAGAADEFARVTAPMAIVPFASALEQAYLPSVDQVVAAVQNMTTDRSSGAVLR